MWKGKRKDSAYHPRSYGTLNPEYSSNDTTFTELAFYKPLPRGNYFRILILHPGDYDDDVKCGLSVQTHRRARNKYAAVSYVWGDPGDVVIVTCDGFPVSITRDLGQALRQFRHPRTIRRLWVDALCINQSDLEEKGGQVRSMGRVFQNAAKVLVWLGDDTRTIAAGMFDMIRRTNEYLDEMFARHGKEYNRMPRLSRPHPIPTDKMSWSGLHTLFHRPWFKRAWTVQECAMAKHCYMFWGSEQIEIAEVYEMSLWCSRYVDLESLIINLGVGNRDQLLVDFQNIHCYYGGNHRWQDSKPGLAFEAQEWRETTFSLILNAGRGFYATDPRDRVFAFLDCPVATRLAKDTFIDVDYALPEEDLWHRVACRLVRHPEEGPWLLGAVKHSNRRLIDDTKRPSWVPYWNFGHQSSVLANPAMSYRAGGETWRFSAKPGRGKTLTIEGFIFGSIIWRSTTFGADDFTLHRFRDQEKHLKDEPVIDRIWRECATALATLGYPLDEDAFTMTLRCTGSHPTDELETHRDYFGAYCEVARNDYHSVVDGGGSVDAATMSKAVHIMSDLTFTKGKCLFLTQHGKLGLGSGDLTKEGDVCCIFLGAPVPFLLTPASNRWHKLVDECYIYGIMYGELLGGFKSAPLFLE